MLRRSASQLVLGCCAVYALYCLATMPSGPITAPDSVGYLETWPIRALGYPLFLNVLGAKGATVAQPIVFAIALAWLGAETIALTSSLWPALAVVLAAMMVPGLAVYHASILTESLFVSGLVALMAATSRFVRAPRWQSAAVASAIAGATATLRPTGLAFLPVLLTMVPLARPRRSETRRMLWAALVPMLAITAGERLAARAVHGDALTNIVGRHLYVKAALLDAPPSNSRSSDPLQAGLEEHLDVLYEPIRRLLDRPAGDVRDVLALYYETCLEGPCVPELGGAVLGREGRQIDEAMMHTALGRIRRAPVAFARLAMMNYESLWAAYRQRRPDTAAALTLFISSNRPLPFERAAFKVDSGDPLVFGSYGPVRFVRPLTMLAAVVTGALTLLGLTAAVFDRELQPALAVACLVALAAQAGLTFNALLAPGISRFIISLWPAITTALILAAWSAVNGITPSAVKRRGGS
jgi:hypothetical protein